MYVPENGPHGKTTCWNLRIKNCGFLNKNKTVPSKTFCSSASCQCNTAPRECMEDRCFKLRLDFTLNNAHQFSHSVPASGKNNWMKCKDLCCVGNQTGNTCWSQTASALKSLWSDSSNSLSPLLTFILHLCFSITKRKSMMTQHQHL